MSVEIQIKSLVSWFLSLLVKKENPNPNYLPPNSPNQTLIPKLSIKNQMKPLRPCQNSGSGSVSVSEDPGSTSFSSREVEAMKVVRSVVAGFLLRRFEEIGMCTPIDNRAIWRCFKKERLLSASEKKSLKIVGLEAAKSNSNEAMKMVESNGEEECFIMGISSALLSMEKDDGVLKCFISSGLVNGNPLIFVMELEPEKLIMELLPPSLTLVDLTLAAEDISDTPSEEYNEWRKEAVIRLLKES